MSAAVEIELALHERWYLVQTLPRSEGKARFHLGAQGFQAYVPEYFKTVRHARKLRTVKAPVFPGYAFVRFDLTRDRWLCIRSTIGVARLLSHRDGRPIPVPAGVVESLIRSSDGQVIRFDRDLVAGRAVRLLCGPLAGFVGTLKRLNDNGRVQVLLDIMGTTMPVTLDRLVLSPAA
jgi:transcription antitermination factor NusG